MWHVFLYIFLIAMSCMYRICWVYSIILYVLHFLSGLYSMVRCIVYGTVFMDLYVLCHVYGIVCTYVWYVLQCLPPRRSSSRCDARGALDHGRPRGAVAHAGWVLMQPFLTLCWRSPSRWFQPMELFVMHSMCPWRPSPW